ncbi:phosphatase PAP2 family protein [Halorubrum luteum]
MIPPETLALVTVLLVAVGLGVAVACWVCVGPHRLRSARSRPAWFRHRLRAAVPYLLGLAAVLIVNKGLQSRIERFSHVYGVDATATLHAIEGDLVVTLQGWMPDPAVAYFAAAYVVGYAVLLVMPLLAYLFAEHARPIKLVVTAYAVNYAVAIVCYATVVAYGPRNAARASPGTEADALLLELVPNINTVTALVNTNTNVFPSLHTSLSVTVLLVAATTREEFPRWFGLAAVLAASVVASTLVLGIHWLTDVVAGAVLAVIAVGFGSLVVDRCG